MTKNRWNGLGVPLPGAARPWASLLLLLLLLSCGRGHFTAPRTVVTLTPEAVPLPGVQLDLGPESAGATIDLRLIVGGPESFYRARYDLAYPAGLLQVDSVTEGPFLSEDGEVVTRLDVQQTPGVVSIDHSRVGDVGSLTEPEIYTTMLVIRMTAFANGSGRIRFTAPQVFDENGASVPGYTWGSADIEIEL